MNGISIISKIGTILILLFFNINIIVSGVVSVGDCIQITNSGNIDFGSVVQGMQKYDKFNNMFIKFEIECCKDEEITIKVENDEIAGFEIQKEWKIGPLTGTEANFQNNGIYKPVNGKIFLIMQVKSIKPLSNIPSGDYIIQPKVTVAYIQEEEN